MTIYDGTLDSFVLTELWVRPALLSSIQPHERAEAMQRPTDVWVLLTVVFLVLLADSFWTSQQLGVLLGRQPLKVPQVASTPLLHASVSMTGLLDQKQC